MAAVVGFAFLLTAVTPVGNRVFLLVITTIPSAMRRMATTAGMVKKSGRWPFKKSAVGVKKQLLVVAHRESNEEEVLYIDKK